MNRGHKQTDLIIMDFAKTFDKVPHRRLLHKLEYYGIRGSTNKWINSWLSERTQQVVLDGQASDPVPVLSGVPQGLVLGPVLFLIFINDLPDNIRSSVRLLTDDCVLYRNIHSLQDCLTLQEDLTSLGQWEADWQMKFNVAKCHSMRVNRYQHHKQILFDYSLHNQTLENVQSAKYLGITITDNMDWGQHVSEISSIATKTLGFLRRNLAFAPRSTKEVACKTFNQPKLEYAAPIWSPHLKLQINQIEKVLRTAARWTCRRWRNTSSVGQMLDELEWPSLEARRDQSSLLLFHKIHSGAVSIEKDKYMTPAHSLKTTRSSHSAQYRRHQTYSDALKNSSPPPPELFHIGIVCLFLWPICSPQRSLGHSLFKQKFSQKLLFFCVCCFLCVFFFFILSKFPNSHSLVLCSSLSEPVTIERKKVYCEFVTFPLVSWVRCGT